MTIVARKDFEPNDLKGLIEYAKANKDTVTFANAGIGAASHLCGMLFMSAIETPLVTVPYKGTGPAMTDLLGGQVDIMCDQTTNTTNQIQGGKIKAYAVTTRSGSTCCPTCRPPRGRAARLRGRHLARPLRAEGHAGRGHRPPVEGPAGGAEGPERGRALRRSRHRAVAGADATPAALKASSRARSPVGSR